MTNFQKIFNVVITGMIVILLLSVFVGNGAGAGKKLGGVYEQVAQYFYDGLYVGTSNQFTISNTGKLTLGSSGTQIGTIIYGTCNLKADFSIVASTTGMVDCVSSSFASGDTVIISGLATSSTAMTRQFGIIGTGSASTTAGFAPVRVANWTGANVVPGSISGLGSSTPFVIIRP